jgi:hypothetical protein
MDVIYRDTSQMRVLNLRRRPAEVPVIACTRFDHYVVRTPCTGTRLLRDRLCLRGALTLVSQGVEKPHPARRPARQPNRQRDSLKTIPAGQNTTG